jgi:hypothetical protein
MISLNGSAEQDGNTVSITEDGKHVLKYWSVDKAGNIESKNTVDINIDKTAPDITFTVEDGTEFKVDKVMSFTCQATDELSGVATTTCEDVSIPAYELGLGSHTFKADAEDVAGNRLIKSVVINVVVDFDSLGRLTGLFLTETGGDHNILGSLTTKLNSAKTSEETGKKGARDGQLNAYINEVQAKMNKDFTEKQVQILKQYAESLMK